MGSGGSTIRQDRVDAGRKRYVLRKAVAAGIGTVIALIAGESFYRVMYSIRYNDTSYISYGIRNVFNYDLESFRGYFKLRSKESPDQEFDGFRTEPFDIEKPANEYRIVALGSSSTFNVSGTYEESWPHVLQEKLNAARHDRRYRVINTGIPSQTMYGIDRLLRDEVFQLKPDVIVIYSIYGHVFFDQPELDVDNEAVKKMFRLLTALLSGKSLMATTLFEKIGERVNLGSPNKFATYRHLLTDMVQVSQARGIKVIVAKELIDPDRFPKSNMDSRTRAGSETSPSQYDDFLNIIDDVCRELGCQVADFSPKSAAVSQSPGDFRKLLLLDAVHLTPHGNELLANTLFHTLSVTMMTEVQRRGTAR
jgi:lysophospholipase L1-like esterase